MFGIALISELLWLLGLGCCSFSVLKLITIQIDHLFWKFLSKSQKLKEKRFTVQLFCKLKQSSLISVWKWLRLIDSGPFRINITLIVIWDQPKSTKVNLTKNFHKVNFAQTTKWDRFQLLAQGLILVKNTMFLAICNLC